MTVRSFYWILFAAIALFLWKSHRIKKLSPYKQKWLITYLLYTAILILLDPYMFGFTDYSYVTDEVIVNIIGFLLVLPLICYLLLPIILKWIGHWKVIKWLDMAIDSIYRTILERDR